MTYASQQQLADRFGADMLVALTDRAQPPAGTVDTAVVERALGDADAAIDGYLKGRYLLPLTATPALVLNLALVISYYMLHRTSVPDKVQKDYDDAIRTLRDIASGVVRLDVAGVEPTSSGSSGVRTNDRKRPFTPDNLKGFV